MTDEKKPTPPGDDEEDDDLDLLNLGELQPGEAYVADEPKFVGKIPPRKDLPIKPKRHFHHCKAPDHPGIDFPDDPEPRILGPDEPKPELFGFEAVEVQGTPIVRVPEDLQNRDPDSFSESERARLKALVDDPYEHCLKSFDDLKVGDKIMSLGFAGWNWSVVDELRPERKNGSALSPGGKTLYMLMFDQDDRHCWACIGSGNLIGLKRLRIQR